MPVVFCCNLNYHGENMISHSIWARDDEDGSASVVWTVLGVVNSAVDPGFEPEQSRPGLSDRSAYY